MQPNPGKSYPLFFYKPLIILFAIAIAILLFPSQPPQSLNQTLLTKLWELLHLLFIGIVVSYGLCSRRISPFNIEPPHSNNNTMPTCFSSLSHISSVFDNGFENLWGSDEKKMTHNWNSQVFKDSKSFEENESVGVFSNGSYGFGECKDPKFSVFKNGLDNPHGSNENKMNYQYFQGEPVKNPRGSEENKMTQKESVGVFSNESYDFDECKDPIFSGFKNGFVNPHESNENKVNQASNSQYFYGESVVVVENGDYGLDQFGKPKSSFGYKPLGLPVRSLRSRIVEADTHEKPKGKIRGLSPVNLEEKFEETVAPSPIPWGLRSGKMEMREELETIKPFSHTRPLSVGDFEFQSFKSSKSPHPISKHSSYSQSVSNEMKNPNIGGLKKETIFHGSSMSYSIPSVAPSNGEESVISSNTQRFSTGSSLPKMEDSNREKAFHRSSLPNSVSSVESINGEKSFFSSKTRRFSIGSSSEVNVQKNFEDKSKDFDKSERGVKQELDSLNSDVKPATIWKSLSRGKSVRTIRSSEKSVKATKTGEDCRNHVKDKVGRKCNKFEAIPRENQPGNTKKQNLDNHASSLNTTFLKSQKGGKQEFFDSTIVESDKESESELEKFQVSSEEEGAGSESVGDAETDCGEVDKKADEFIAKFKEQIRLQKASSIKGRLHFW